MILADVHLANNLVRARTHVLHLRDGCRLQGQLIGTGPLATNETLDPPMLALLRPVIVAELDRRLELIDADLAAIGVDVG